MRLHSVIGYVTPHDMLAGRQAEIHAVRDRKLEQARHQRQLRRAAYVDMDRLSPIGQRKTLQLNVSISTLPEKK